MKMLLYNFLVILVRKIVFFLIKKVLQKLLLDLCQKLILPRLPHIFIQVQAILLISLCDYQLYIKVKVQVIL